MSDFLSRLIDRSAGTASVARPVIPPLFGPGPAAYETSTDTPPLPEGASAEAPSASARPPAPPAVVPVAPRSVPALFSADTETSSAGPVTPRSEPPVATGESLERPRDPPHPAAAPPVLPSRARAPSADDVAPLPVRVSVRAPGAPLAPVFATRPVRASPLRPAEAVLPAPGRSTERLGEASAEDAPTVLVTIGRIEVKATTPAAPPRRPAPRKPAAVSLEDYLQPRRRNR